MSKVFTVISGKGGVGKTTIASNLGVSLSLMHKTTVVVDADLAMGGIATILGLGEAPVSLHELLADKGSVEKAIHSTHGLDVLPSGPTIEGFLKADPKKLKRVVDKLAKTHDYVIIDSPPGLNKYSLAPLKAADEVLLVVTPDIQAVQATAKLQKVIDAINATVRGVIVNRYRKPSFFAWLFGAKDPLGKENIERELKAKVLGVIPEDPAVIESINMKKSVILHKPKSRASQAITTLAENLVK